MGGEWIFTFRNDDEKPLDVIAYQQKLRELKANYSQEAMKGATWFDENPDDNIYAKFVYECHRHAHWGDGGHKPVWHLLWNPISVLSSDSRFHVSDVHARCAPYDFKVYSNIIQQELERDFPKNFSVYWGDGLSGVGSEFDCPSPQALSDDSTGEALSDDWYQEYYEL
ncbi:hypothetical protein O6H91_04G056300 [Diphasiastrum complanatum]|uniref:Uncharacterized protein n=1 Tax=Diphasiastrum complanatum TaxID=34168 RepID=A0ACC2DX53_DIPCM|nr:hypothetical protein O6H91_04G056300 [Diphasiastrum complanatum]